MRLVVGTVVGSDSFGNVGQQYVYGGLATSTTVNAGGVEYVQNGGVAIATTVNVGGAQIISSGSTASGTIVSSGGIELVSSGASLVDATLSGGTVEILSGGTAGASPITTAGTLILDDSQHFSGSIAGLLTSGAQTVDLMDINFATLTLGYTSNTGSGVLSASDGAGHTAQLNMIGNYTLANFVTKAADDGHGGTLITDPPVSSGAGIAAPH